jgi:uncharacterized membrane protein YphA (DoxX/SURF4 family)
MQINYLVCGRILFGLAMLGFGIVCLVYLDFVSALQPVPASLPGYQALATLTGVVLLAVGIAIITNIRTRAAGLTLVVLFVVWILLLHLPSAFTNPALLRSPFWIRTFETVALAGAALILVALASDPVREDWLRIGRIAFGISPPVVGVLHLIYPQNVAALVTTAAISYPWPMFWAYLTGVAHITAGIAIATGMFARLAAILAGFMYASWALTLHLVRVIDNPPLRSADFPQGYGGDRGELTSLFVCVGFWGAAWIVAGALKSSPPRLTLAEKRM